MRVFIEIGGCDEETMPHVLADAVPELGTACPGPSTPGKAP